jgi:hypothetical protein
MWLTAHPVDHVEFFKKRLGQKRYDALTVRANTMQRPDEKMVCLVLQEELKKFKPFIFGARK